MSPPLLHHCRKAGAPLDRLPERLVAPGEVGREHHPGPVGVDEAGGAQPDRLHLETSSQLGDQVSDGILGGARIM
jgi:hypothetical protein